MSEVLKPKHPDTANNHNHQWEVVRDIEFSGRQGVVVDHTTVDSA